jgi:hypothetical protein
MTQDIRDLMMNGASGPPDFLGVTELITKWFSL